MTYIEQLLQQDLGGEWHPIAEIPRLDQIYDAVLPNCFYIYPDFGVWRASSGAHTFCLVEPEGDGVILIAGMTPSGYLANPQLFIEKYRGIFTAQTIRISEHIFSLEVDFYPWVKLDKQFEVLKENIHYILDERIEDELDSISANPQRVYELLNRWGVLCNQ